jgi:hypothetical protein
MGHYLQITLPYCGIRVPYCWIRDGRQSGRDADMLTRKNLTDKSCVKTGIRENFCALGRENFFPSLETIFSTCGNFFAF